MAHAVRLHAQGGPDELRWEPVEAVTPGAGELAIRQRAVGLNYIDVYHRTGLYPLASLPAVIGMEGAGEVSAIGPGVTGFAIGDRVAYAGVLGGYAEERTIPADRVVRLPDGISYEVAAASLLRGMTVRYLFRETYPVGPETVMLFHAAAGGVGLIACQWARALGATLIGTVGTDEKGKLALASGAAHVINYQREDFLTRVRELTGGRGCDVVYDSVGQASFEDSLQCLKPRGLMVSYGNASGPVPPFDLKLLRGSLFVTRPSLMAYTATREELTANAAEYFGMIQAGAIRVKVGSSFPLSEAAAAHRALEARQTTGATVLTVA